jgi:hypothetical protein
MSPASSPSIMFSKRKGLSNGKKIYLELDKVTLVKWVDKALM